MKISELREVETGNSKRKSRHEWKIQTFTVVSNPKIEKNARVERIIQYCTYIIAWDWDSKIMITTWNVNIFCLLEKIVSCGSSNKSNTNKKKQNYSILVYLYP